MPAIQALPLWNWERPQIAPIIIKVLFITRYRHGMQALCRTGVRADKTGIAPDYVLAVHPS